MKRESIDGSRSHGFGPCVKGWYGDCGKTHDDKETHRRIATSFRWQRESQLMPGNNCCHAIDTADMVVEWKWRWLLVDMVYMAAALGRYGRYSGVFFFYRFLSIFFVPFFALIPN